MAMFLKPLVGLYLPITIPMAREPPLHTIRVRTMSLYPAKKVTISQPLKMLVLKTRFVTLSILLRSDTPSPDWSYWEWTIVGTEVSPGACCQGVPGAVYKTLSLLARQKVKPGLFDALCAYPENDL